MASYTDIQERLANASQEHLLKFWDYLTEVQQNEFLAHLSSINYEEADQLFQRAMSSVPQESKNLDSRMKPIPPNQFESEEKSTHDQLDRYRFIGLEEISKGHIGVVLLAGGQGTRLGVPYPKGMYSIGLPSGKTLFQVQAERILKLERLSKRQTGINACITWYIMTSDSTGRATEEFFKANNFFGLAPENIVQFEQRLLPCFDMFGRMILEDINRVALAPDGNGGMYSALAQKGILDDMRKRGIRYVHVHSVDNILIKVADPVFIGYCVEKQADCGSKVVKKINPLEAIGVLCQVDGRFQVVEYSEIAEATASLKDDKGNLVFDAGNICNHFFSTNFLSEIAEKYEKKLKLHVARKKIDIINDFMQKKEPATINSIKIEKFIFDVFEFSNNFVTWEVPRHTEFSALKNSDDVGKDCSSTARRDLLLLHKRYVEEAGGTVVGDVVEISPLVTYAGEDLIGLVKGKIFHSPVLLDSDA